MELISPSMCDFLGSRTGIGGEGPDKTDQIPDMLVRFDSSKRRHTTQTNPVLHNPKQFSVGVLLYLGRSQIGCSRVHPSSRVSRLAPRVTVALGTVGAEELVAFAETRIPIRWCRRNFSSTRSSYEETLALSCERRLHSSRLRKRAQIKSERGNAADEQQEQNDDCQYEKRPLHVRAPKSFLEIQKQKKRRGLGRSPSPRTTTLRTQPRC